jgi:predicted acetyltransferase
MNIEIRPASIDDKPLLQRMMELYQYDFSEFEGNDLDSHGCFGYCYLDLYWVEPDRHPFIVRVDGKLAGFVLVNRYTYMHGGDWTIAEFFIMRKYRRQGIGKRVAFAILDRSPGAWEVQQTETNLPAQAFWRKVISEYTNGNYEETYVRDERWRGPIRSFRTRQAERQG